MKLLLWLGALLFVLFTGSSCSENMAKDGTKRGRIYFVGNVVNNGKE